MNLACLADGEQNYRVGTLEDLGIDYETHEAWEAILVPAGIPMGAINTIDEVVEHPQVREREMIIDHEHVFAVGGAASRLPAA